MRANVTALQAWGKLARGTITGACPACRRASMFRGVYAIHERCPVCGLRYEAESGAWLGAIAIGYGIGAVVVVLLGVAEVLWHPIARTTGLDPLWTITIIGLLVTAPAYRPAKGFWFVLLWLYGFTQDGNEPPG